VSHFDSPGMFVVFLALVAGALVAGALYFVL
jgi:hypothetical protein